MDAATKAELAEAAEAEARDRERLALQRWRAEDFNAECDHVALCASPLSLDALVARVLVPAAGAVSTFSGVTRDNFEGRAVLRLEYEAYEPMALRELRKLCVGARALWPSLLRIAIEHRTGVVPISEASVVIAVASDHRGEGLAAVAHLIDELKARVPIWKREVYAPVDGASADAAAEASRWKANSECLHHHHHHHHHQAAPAAPAESTPSLPPSSA
eukprot:Amastigsp_a340386_71.p1 type:complete len:217 gc:universal Amastigsp_a340386_71:384-1034(+)